MSLDFLLFGNNSISNILMNRENVKQNISIEKSLSLYN